jgi:hypothetical protein
MAESLLIVAVVVAAFATFFAVMAPVVLLANKAIGSAFENEAARMKASLPVGSLAHREDDVKLQVSAVALLGYLMRYHLMFGRFRFGQPNFRVTWDDEPRVGGFTPLRIVGRPRIDESAVVIEATRGITAFKLRIQSGDPMHLLSSIEGMR